MQKKHLFFVTISLLLCMNSCSNSSSVNKEQTDGMKEICFHQIRNGNLSDYHIVIHGDSLTGNCLDILKGADTARCLIKGVGIGNNEYRCQFKCVHTDLNNRYESDRENFLKITNDKLYFKRNGVYEIECEKSACQ